MAVADQSTERMSVEAFYSASWVPENFVELVEGELVQMVTPSWRHGEVAFNIAALFSTFCASRPDLTFCAENNGFLVRRNPDSVLVPDAALFRRELRGDSPWLTSAPEIAVEVLSPGNSQAEMTFKRRLYFTAGTEQVWQVNIERQEIQFYYREDRVVTVTGDEVIEGEGIAAGMQISLREVFRTR